DDSIEHIKQQTARHSKIIGEKGDCQPYAVASFLDSLVDAPEGWHAIDERAYRITGADRVRARRREGYMRIRTQNAAFDTLLLARLHQTSARRRRTWIAIAPT